MVQVPLLLLLLTCVAAAGADAQVALERVATAQQAHTTVQGALTRKVSRLDDPAAPPRISKVGFLVQFPDRYNLLFTDPKDPDYREGYRSDGSRRWVVVQSFPGVPPDVKTAAVGEGDELPVRLIRALRLDLAGLRRDFRVEPRLAGGVLSVALTPLAPELAAELSVLVVDFGADDRPRRVVMDDPQGNRNELTVDEVQFDQPIDPAAFRWGQ
jgi:outer membrane lipoprotein-sorting protein